MDLKKFGAFMKTLRSEKGLTQEKLAEKYGVSNRAVSRWETGTNVPDLDILIQLSEDYGVTIRELLDGERKETAGDGEWQKTAAKIVDYSNNEKNMMTRMMLWFFIAGATLLIAYLIMWELELPDTGTWGFLQGLTQGASLGIMCLGILYTSGRMTKWQRAKKRVLKEQWNKK